ncbi:MAG: winged helix-turn-helix transcriptional regulator [Methanobacteriaceae archaeon]|jgi:phosphate transport system protein|nr:winged helix-turn-helix transcriptional regulator [Methanobacteriaceae archaeon]
MTKKRNTTLKDILDFILYENPSTQEEIADRLGITRRYVTELLKPLIDEEIVKKAYVVDLKSYEQAVESLGLNLPSKDMSGNILINEMLNNMSLHVQNQLEISFLSIVENDPEKAQEALEMDYVTNNLFDKIRNSVETIVSINKEPSFSKSVIFNEVAYDLERIGDYCGHIAKFALNDVYEVDEDILKNIKKLYKASKKMIILSMDSFLKGKIELKGDIMDLEELLHTLQNSSMNIIAVQMAETSFDDTDRSNYFIYLSRVIKAFERIGDICVEIVDISGEFHKNIPRSNTPRTFRE